MTHVTAGCVCGAWLDTDAFKLTGAVAALSVFQEVHTGPGHGTRDV
jgi:hypothetical protein